jgi:hypothetical protein
MCGTGPQPPASFAGAELPGAELAGAELALHPRQARANHATARRLPTVLMMTRLWRSATKEPFAARRRSTKPTSNPSSVCLFFAEVKGPYVK